MTLGVDYAWSHPNVSQMFDAGVRFAGRYVGAGSEDKRLTRDEALALNTAGIAVVSLVEGAERDMLRGYGTGYDHAKAAVRDLKAIGADPTRPMYFAADWDVQATDWPAISQYLMGAAAVIAGIGSASMAGIARSSLPMSATWFGGCFKPTPGRTVTGIRQPPCARRTITSGWRETMLTCAGPMSLTSVSGPYSPRKGEMTCR